MRMTTWLCLFPFIFHRISLLRQQFHDVCRVSDVVGESQEQKRKGSLERKKSLPVLFSKCNHHLADNNSKQHLVLGSSVVHKLQYVINRDRKILTHTQSNLMAVPALGYMQLKKWDVYMYDVCTLCSAYLWVESKTVSSFPSSLAWIHTFFMMF